jgi:hypothetical protein
MTIRSSLCCKQKTLALHAAVSRAPGVRMLGTASVTAVLTWVNCTLQPVTSSSPYARWYHVMFQDP